MSTEEKHDDKNRTSQPGGKIPIVSYTEASARPGAEKTLSGSSRGGFFGLIARRTEVSSEDLQKNLHTLLVAMGNVLGGQETQVGGYQIEELEIEVEVSAEGEVSLFGTGGKVGGKGSLTLKLRRHG